MDKHNFFEDKKQKNNLKNYLIIQPKLFVHCIYLWKFINNSLMIFLLILRKHISESFFEKHVDFHVISNISIRFEDNDGKNLFVFHVFQSWNATDTMIIFQDTIVDSFVVFF